MRDIPIGKSMENQPLRLHGLKPGVCSGLILSGAFYPDLKIGVWRRRTYQIFTCQIFNSWRVPSIKKLIRSTFLLLVLALVENSHRTGSLLHAGPGPEYFFPNSSDIPVGRVRSHLHPRACFSVPACRSEFLSYTGLHAIRT